MLNSSKRHNNTLSPENLTAEHTESKLLKTKAGKAGSWPDGEPIRTFTHGTSTASLRRTSKWQVTCRVLYQRTRTVPGKASQAGLEKRESEVSRAEGEENESSLAAS